MDARKIFKRLKAGLTTYDELTDEELHELLKHYPFLFKCEFIVNGLVCGNDVYAIVIADGERIPVCKQHLGKLTFIKLHQGKTVRWLKKY